MKPVVTLVAIVNLVTILSAQSIPHRFSAKTASSADSVNANFDYLVGLVKALKSQDSINNPLGMIIASTVAPDNRWLDARNK